MKKLLYIFAIIFICITSCDRTDKPITLSVDKKEIIADDQDFVTFKVLCEGKDVTDESTIILKDGNIELGTAVFSTSEAKSYTFFARRKSHDSNEVTITAKNPEPENPEEPQLEGPIFLTASTDTIVANGIDAVNFTAIQDSVDVTSSVKFFVNDNIIESNVFSTELSGDYVVYAKKNDTIISNEISFYAKKYVEPEIPIVIAASTDTIVADGIDAIIFTVTEGKRNITNNIDIYVNGNKIEGNKFSTTTAGEYSAYAKRDDVTSNEISFYAKGTEEPEEPEKPIELFASKTNIIADGIDAVTFTVKQDNIDVTSEVEIFINGNKIDGNSFTTTTAGNYNVNAKKGELVSNELNITAEEYIEPEKPIELSASTTSITANGTDVISFTVIQDGDNVTDQSEIYVNNNLITGNQFSTFTPGTYTAYAKKNEVISNEISFTAEAGSDTGTTIVFAEGVTVNSGWYDVNKVGMGENGDINMCWAASCSNIIQWWQDRYIAAGNSLPANAVTGPGANGTYQLALMDMYHSLWDNSRGGSIAMGIEWYFNGRNIEQYASPGSIAVPLDENSGGYYEDIWESQILPNTFHDYVHVIVPGTIEFDNLISIDVNNYTVWGGGSGLSGIDRLKKFSDLVVEYMSRGMMSLTISLNANGGLMHATTLWGYEIDNATGLLTKVWLTDSDDLETEPKTEILHECTVSYDETSGKVKFTGIPRYGAFYAMTLSPVSIYGSL
ncbi:MAG: IdeS/Mac family cysteine endopeptidase [Bacteroidales bacterium]|nr:IdeS/Mac family cysteine endopeptidase [Bacteroidales bacterium]